MITSGKRYEASAVENGMNIQGTMTIESVELGHTVHAYVTIVKVRRNKPSERFPTHHPHASFNVACENADGSISAFSLRWYEIL